MDWYRNAQKLLAPQKVLFATDLIDSEGNTKLVQDSDCIINLYNIDWLLLPRQSYIGNIWRNFVKTMMVPLQVWHTRRIAKKYASNKKLIFHAHTMYYMWVCWFAGVLYVGTPQGSEILVRPKRSLLYKYFAKKSLAAAQHITVDSIKMATEIKQISGRDALIVQNGIDVSAIRRIGIKNVERTKIVSIRILHQNYRIDKIIEGRTQSSVNMPIDFVYPQWEDEYKKKCFSMLQNNDNDIGRLSRDDLYSLLIKTFLVISIPESDSSPRSVYEAIFCGCCVGVTYNPWIENIPSCMKDRLYIFELGDQNWFRKAVDYAKVVTRKHYEPSEKALDLFDQVRSMQRVIELCYNSDHRIRMNAV